MSDRSKPVDNPNATNITEAAAKKANKKLLMLFGKDQTPQQIIDAITEAYNSELQCSAVVVGDSKPEA
ncbi:MAG: EndoU domain-containing protein [Candidatus Eremiobacteraeota bacterium]|nr:EndoU domain-containing protein [Candidatus Eremiobacteraeota bacterium]